ncbi:tRNA (guanosine(18)-2'-O)-methyltransferase [Nocardioides sp. T2.26MG-1]|uniref:TrmH family RNA methyltransferase n=1 Tax=Nocardioides sp. T2.26MG-1 TaxID=3041166 RepID=UPI002477A47A|nr:RNA methyltransferase [Nocardioides sp. T2.26MG-1]CAI9406428.1 tRNA (guanosine(18)-2'-O)-methyltransferase [Nocardioides sp. T2.26MG-1]
MSRRSERSERRLFLAEGRNAVEAALEAGVVVEVFAKPHTHYLLPDIPDGVRLTFVDERALKALSDAVTPAGVVALCRFVDVPLEQALVGGYVALCAHVSDPGNAGTVIRCADAAGAGGVVLAGHSVDLYNAKTIRASAGSAFHLPVTTEVGAEEAVLAARSAGYQVLSTEADGDVDLFDADEVLARPTVWLLGNEAHGLPPELAALADHRVRIPIHGRAESLNLSTAAALCLYASARAQRHA